MMVRRAGASAIPVRFRLSQTLLWLTIAAELLTSLLIFLPDLARFRTGWLDTALIKAHLAALPGEALPNRQEEIQTRNALLALSGIDLVEINDGTTRWTIRAIDAPLPAGTRIALGTESEISQIEQALGVLFGPIGGYLEVQGASPLLPGSSVRVILRRATMQGVLRRFSLHFWRTALLTFLATGVLLYVALVLLVVRPLTQLIQAITDFRANPERAVAPKHGPRLLPGNEIAVAADAFASMRSALRTALWRQARLAAIGTAVAKINHDLRGILAPAMLTAERLLAHPDPAVRRAGRIVERTVERATEVARTMVGYVRDNPAAMITEPHLLRPVVEAAAKTLAILNPAARLINHVAPDLAGQINEAQFQRIITNLLRNAAEAAATEITVSATEADGKLLLDISDNGHGIADSVRARLFQPFANDERELSTGLGLAIARDLARAHKAEIALVATSPRGTIFRITLPAIAPARAAAG
jgi:signal transduction histidine kinase